MDANLRTLGILFGNRSNAAHRLLMLFNAGGTELSFTLPSPPPGQSWMCRFDTARDAVERTGSPPGGVYPLVGNSAVLLEC
jgi:hypothetical protein